MIIYHDYFQDIQDVSGFSNQVYKIIVSKFDTKIRIRIKNIVHAVYL